MLSWFFKRSLTDTLHKTKCVRIKGIRFHIKKIDATTYLTGAQVMLQSYDTKNVDPNKIVNQDKITPNINKMKSHYADVFLASVVSPRLVRKPEDGVGVLVDDLFLDWPLVNELYQEIIAYTYGVKKKTILRGLAKNTSSS